MNNNNIDVLKKALIIKPLIFKAPSEQTNQYNFVEPCFVNSSVRPVTDDDIKTLKTYLNAIIKLDRYHGTANVAEITKQGMQANTQSSAEVAKFLDNYNISYDMFNNQDLEEALGICNRCTPEPQDAKTKKKAIKFLQTLIKQPLINKKATEQVTNYLTQKNITYNAVSKKSLRKAIAKCKKTPVCQKFDEKTKQNAINYLTGLLNGKRARKIKNYQDVRSAYATKVANVLRDLNIGSDDSVINWYLRKEHTTKLQYILKSDGPPGTARYFNDLLEHNPGAKALDRYENACTAMVNAIEPRLINLNDISTTIKSEYNRYAQTLVTHAKEEKAKDENLIPPQSARDISKLGNEAAVMADITDGMKTACGLVGGLNDLVGTAKEILNKIEPLAAYLKRCSGKARMLGKTTLYTKLSETLEEELRTVRKQLNSLLSTRNTLICVGCGLMRVNEEGNVCDSDNTVMTLLSNLESFNNISTSLDNQLQRQEALPGSYKDLIDRHREQSEKIQAFAELVEAETGTISAEGLESGRNSPKLPMYVGRMSEKLEQANLSIEELSEVASGIDEFIRDAKRSVVGRIALFKERHRVSIDTAKTLGHFVKQVVEVIPH